MSLARLSKRVAFTLIAAFLVSLATSKTHAQTCPFDDGNSSLAVEGLILTRYALGITGAPLVAGTGISAVDAPTVEAAINCPSCGLNITGNPTMTVADATIISRKLAGFSGAQLTNGLALGSGTRNTPAAVQSFLLSGCGATGGTVTSITAGAGLTGGTITTAGTIAADPTFLQRRVSASCAAGSSIRAIAADGTVTCQTDAVGGSGTVTNVATGPGLTGGPVTSSGTIGLAATQLMPTTACANNQIPKWNGTAWSCANEAAAGSGTVTGVATGIGLTGGPITTTGTINIQSSFRLPQTCTADQMARWNGTSWVCATVPPLPAPCNAGQSLTYTSSGEFLCVGGPTAAVRVDSVDSVGYVPRIATGTDGFPVISYYDRTNVAIKVAKCSNTACSGANSVVSVASPGGSSNQVYSSIAVPADGRPVISYQDITNTALMFVRCADSACTGPNTPITLDNTGVSSGGTSAIAISSDGFPVISHHATAVALGTTMLRVYKCSNADCTAGSSSDVDTGGVGLQSSIAVPADGLPVISYYETAARNLRIAKCSTASCSGAATITLYDVAEESGGNTSIAIGTDGLPVVAYTSNVTAAPSSIKVLKCATADCASGSIAVVDSSAANVFGPSIKVPADGLPVISYYDQTNTRLKTVKCGNASCSASNTFTVVDPGPFVGQSNSIAIAGDGLPVIAYYDEANFDLKVYKCANAFCRAP